MPEFTTNHEISYPVASDRIRDPNSAAKLASDIRQTAQTTDAAITAAAAQAEDRAYDRARWKKGTIPNGVDVRQYMRGREGQYASWFIESTATMTGLPEDLIKDPAAFTAVAETLNTGTTITLTSYSVYSIERYVCNSAPSTAEGWSKWRKQKWDDGEEPQKQVPQSPGSGFKTLPLILTAGRSGGENLAPLTGTVEYDVNLSPSIYVSRYRFAIRDGNPRFGTSTAQAIALSNISMGGVSKLSRLTTKADGDITFSPWMTGDFGNLKFDYSAPQAPRLLVGGGKLNGSRKTEMPFELWLEVEMPATTPAIGLIGDSNSVAVNATIPVNDSWMAQYCRAKGFFPVLYGHSGDGMNATSDPAAYKWNRWDHLDHPDVVVHANGANDLKAAEGEVTLAQMQTRARAEWAVAAKKISPIQHGVVIKSSEPPTNNSVRVAYNNWIKSLPDPLRDWHDIASPVTANDTGGLLPQYTSSDGLHMNTAGHTAIANSLTKVLTTRNGVTVRETAGRTVSVWDYLNQREQLVYGNTGWRDISSFVPGYLSGALLIKRENNTTWLRFDNLKAADQSTTFSVWSGVVPTGFRFSESGYDYHPLAPQSSSYATGPIRTDRFGGITVYLVQGGKVMQGTVSWTTGEPWPTSPLPGVAA